MCCRTKGKTSCKEAVYFSVGQSCTSEVSLCLSVLDTIVGSNVIWNDEKMITMLDKDGTRCARRSKGERFDPNHQKPAVQQSGGSVMIWAAFFGRGPLHRIRGIINVSVYYVYTIGEQYIWTLDGVVRPYVLLTHS